MKTGAWIVAVVAGLVALAMPARQTGAQEPDWRALYGTEVARVATLRSHHEACFTQVWAQWRQIVAAQTALAGAEPCEERAGAAQTALAPATATPAATLALPVLSR